MTGHVPYDEVADIMRNWQLPNGLAAEVSNRYGIPLNTARGWIQTCRRRGLVSASTVLERVAADLGVTPARLRAVICRHSAYGIILRRRR